MESETTSSASEISSETSMVLFWLVVLPWGLGEESSSNGPAILGSDRRFDYSELIIQGRIER